MAVNRVNTIVVGAGQAGVAMSEHLGRRGVEHLVLERRRIAESWRTARWDSLVANGPVWHDRFPGMLFDEHHPDAFAHHDEVADYFEAYARMIDAPVRCGVDVLAVRHAEDGETFMVETSDGTFQARNVVAATGPFQQPVIPDVIPSEAGVEQIHSNAYRNPARMPDGAILVIGAGSSGAQIADELRRAGREVYLCVGPHDRPPRRYRGKDFVWWLGALGIWDMKTPSPDKEHVTIAVSGAHGGATVDFRELASRGVTLLGSADGYADGVVRVRDDLARNIAEGDANYLSLLDAADRHVAENGLDFPEEQEARAFMADPQCLAAPLRELDLAAAGVASVIWATGYRQDFGWLGVDALNDKGRPEHRDGVSKVPGLYFIGLPWLTSRGSSFIWGCWRDAEHLAAHIRSRD